MKIGAYFVVPLSEGTILRDGGVSFGVLSKAQWSRFSQPDAQNCVKFSLTSFLIQGNGRNILFDAGIGEKLGRQGETHLQFQRRATMDELLGTMRLTREDIDLVVCSHLHFASAGGLTRLDSESVLVPGFPKARVMIQQGEWERAIHANLRTRALYNKENFEPLLWHQALELVEGDMQILPGLKLSVTGGHTRWHQILTIESEGEGAVFFGDLIPSTAHLPLNAISALDLYPLKSLATKAKWLNKAIKDHWVCFFSRDAEVAAAQLSGAVRGENGVTFDPLLTHG